MQKLHNFGERDFDRLAYKHADYDWFNCLEPIKLSEFREGKVVDISILAPGNVYICLFPDGSIKWRPTWEQAFAVFGLDSEIGSDDKFIVHTYGEVHLVRLCQMDEEPGHYATRVNLQIFRNAIVANEEHLKQSE